MSEFMMYGGVNIQCPECSGILWLESSKGNWCWNCHKAYTEAEIRERCGI